MITLITGGPGTGKTAWILDQLVELRKREPDKLLYIHGIRNLRGLPYEQIYCRSQLCDICRAQDADIQVKQASQQPPKFVENWFDWKVSGSLIVVDEVQRIWRPASGGAAPSEAISALETHRHYGLDFWLISQGPHLFHNFIRLLVGRHVHLVAKWSGRKEFEWPECKQDVQSRTDAVERVYTLPKQVYDMYDSAEVHTQQDKRKPLSFYAAIASLFLAVVAVAVITYRIKDRVSPQNTPVAAGLVGGAVPAAPPSDPAKKVVVRTADDIFSLMIPLIPGLPWTAPIYAELAKPVSMPVLAGCALNKKNNRCSCYSQQATIIYVSPDVCVSYVAHLPFNHFRADQYGRKDQQKQESKNLIASK